MLHEVVDRAAAADPDGVAVAPTADGGGAGNAITFGELSGRLRQVAGAVTALTEPGERVAVVGDNHPVWIECYYGVPAAGRILVFLNHRLSPAELASILERSGASVLIGSADQLRRLEGYAPSVGVRESFAEWSDRVDAAAPLPALASDSAAAAWLLFTSGTTAQPKGAVLTHDSILAAVRVTAAARPAAPDDVYLFAFPLCHIAGYNLVHHHFRARPVVLMPRFEAEAFALATERYGATSTSLAATMLSALLDHVEETGTTSVRTLRSIAYGAAPMPLTVLRRAARLLDADFAQGYGMTELSGNAVFLGPDEHRRGLAGDTWLLGAAGKPGPGVSVRVVDDNMSDAPTGDVGEIVVRGDQVMAGYWHEPEMTAEALRDGWFRTGDIGRFDPEGWLYVVDRKKDVIVSGGENISSRQVEEVLHLHPAVKEVAVVGVPDPRWGENVCAVVVPWPGQTIDGDDLVRIARESLAGFKVPRHVVTVEELPKNAAGKVVKAELRAWLAGDPSARGPRR